MTRSSSTPTTLRSATARGRVVDATPDDGELGASRAAAAMAVKHVPAVFAHLRALADHDVEVVFELDDVALTIQVDVEAVTTTDVAPYALAAVMAAAVCVIDLLNRRLNVSLSIDQVGVVATKGGAAQFGGTIANATADVIVLSDTVAAGDKPDTAGRSILEGLEQAGFTIGTYEVLTDDAPELSARLQELLAGSPDLIVTVGGTGLGPRDNTVAVVQPLLTTEVPGLMEAARAFGQARTPYAALSRGVAGIAGNTVVVTFPGSRKGARETLDAILTGLVHLIEVGRMTRPHTDGYT